MFCNCLIVKCDTAARTASIKRKDTVFCATIQKNSYLAENILIMVRKWIHRALKGASLTTALFVFQACYGTPPSMDMEIPEEEPVELVGEETAVSEDGEALEIQEQAADQKAE